MALNPTRNFFKHVDRSPIIKENGGHRARFEAKIRGVLTGYAVTMVTYYVTKMTVSVLNVKGVTAF